MPFIENRITHILSPAFIVSVGYTGIKITIVDNNTKSINQTRVHITRKILSSFGVTPAWSLSTDSPGVARVANMDGLHDNGLVKISTGSRAINAGIRAIKRLIGDV
jgi:hypothetical protein